MMSVVGWLGVALWAYMGLALVINAFVVPYGAKRKELGSKWWRWIRD